MEKAKETLNRIKSFLTRCENNIQQALADPRINQWGNIDFEKHAERLAYFELPLAEIRKASESLNKSTRNILQQIEHWKNDLGNLEADINMQSVTPERAQTLASALEKEFLTLKEQMGGLKNVTEILIAGDLELRQKMTLKGLVPLARKINSKSADNFEDGLEIYMFITKNETIEGNDTKLSDYFAKANDLQIRLENVKLPDMPGLAQAVIRHHTDTAINAIEIIKDFINSSNEKFADKISAVDAVKQEILSVQDESLSNLLKKYPNTAQSLGISITEFQFNKYILNKLKLVSSLLDNLYLFHSTLRHHFLSKLASQMRAEGNPINPQTVSAEKSDEFFSGVKGVMRSIRLLVSSLSGHQVLSDTELEQYLAQLLDSCPVYYGNSKDDIKKIEKEINKYIGNFDRPFPYEPLTRTMKNGLATFGSRLEKFINSFKLDKQAGEKREKSLGPATKPPATLGLLLKQISAQTQDISATM